MSTYSTATGAVTPPPEERFTIDELRLLQSVLITDKKSLDYIEAVVTGTDLTDRRAGAAILALKVRRMLDRELTVEIQTQQLARKIAIEVEEAARKKKAEVARTTAANPPVVSDPDLEPPSDN